ncbi:MAG: ferredoxin [Desulfovibrionaceae bacterium]
MLNQDTKQREIILDQGRCHGCMGCHEMCPALIGWDEENDRPILKKNKATEEEIQEAMACCPKDCFELGE